MQKTKNHRYNRLILFICSGVLALIIVLVVIFEITSNNSEQDVETITQLYQQLSTLRANTPSEQNSEALEALSNSTRLLIDSSSSSYIQARARFLLATIYFDQEQWKKASETFASIFEHNSKTYLAPIALYNQAVSLEMDNNITASIATLEKFVRYYELQEVANLPKAIFNLARIYEKNRDIENAQKYYQQIIDRHSGSGYLPLAINRLILLKIDRP